MSVWSGWIACLLVYVVAGYLYAEAIDELTDRRAATKYWTCVFGWPAVLWLSKRVTRMRKCEVKAEELQHYDCVWINRYLVCPHCRKHLEPGKDGPVGDMLGNFCER